MARRRRPLPQEPVFARIEALDQEGRGVARVDGKVVFIEGALPGEEVRFRYRKCHGRYDEGLVWEVLQGAPERVPPRCPHFGVCGGCSLQHLDHSAQLAHKQAYLRQSLTQFGQVAPGAELDPITDRIWGYRRKARLAVKYVPEKGGVLVGFREKHSNRVASLSRCEVLEPSIGLRLRDLQEVLNTLEARDRIPQIEVAIGEGKSSEVTTALVIRHLVPLRNNDLEALRIFGKNHAIHLYLQPGGLDTVAVCWPDDAGAPSYSLPDFRVWISFLPTDFIQVNAAINRSLVARAVALLQAGGRERVLDLFCGVGNFTLPAARHAGWVVGLEGSAALVDRARANAVRNGLPNAEFQSVDLTRTEALAPWLGERWDKLLLDPPRTGALEVVENLQPPYPARIVYVSCNPATLARDAGILVHRHGFQLTQAGIVDMFPHTSHMESIALFER
jgi:23S rRNA (uracil1939-C5)-methyltransferase